MQEEVRDIIVHSFQHFIKLVHESLSERLTEPRTHKYITLNGYISSCNIHTLYNLISLIVNVGVGNDVILISDMLDA